MMNSNKGLDRKKELIDERQELNSLKNAKKCWSLTLILLALSVIIQITLYQNSPSHYLPEVAIVLIVSILNLFMEIRQGNLYIRDNMNRKKNLLLYFSMSLAFSAITGIGYYIRVYSNMAAILIYTVCCTAFMFGLMLLVDFIFRRATLSRLKKLDVSQEEDSGTIGKESK